MQTARPRYQCTVLAKTTASVVGYSITFQDLGRGRDEAESASESSQPCLEQRLNPCLDSCLELSIATWGQFAATSEPVLRGVQQLETRRRTWARKLRQREEEALALEGSYPRRPKARCPRRPELSASG